MDGYDGELWTLLKGPLLPYLPSAAAPTTPSVVSGDGEGYDCPVDGCYGDGNDNSLMWSYANPCLL